jgi:hypothetical protein
MMPNLYLRLGTATGKEQKSHDCWVFLDTLNIYIKQNYVLKYPRNLVIH